MWGLPKPKKKAEDDVGARMSNFFKNIGRQLSPVNAMKREKEKAEKDKAVAAAAASAAAAAGAAPQDHDDDDDEGSKDSFDSDSGDFAEPGANGSDSGDAAVCDGDGDGDGYGDGDGDGVGRSPWLRVWNGKRTPDGVAVKYTPVARKEEGCAIGFVAAEIGRPDRR